MTAEGIPTEAAPQTRAEMIARAQGVVVNVVRRFRPPPGYSHDDLVSEANVVLCRVADQHDPARGDFFAFAAAVARNAVLQLLERLGAEKRGGGATTVPLQAEAADGEAFGPPADARAADPAEIAAVRESLAPPARRRHLSVRQIRETLPTPGEVADQVVRLRAAMFAAVSEADVGDVMQAVVREAKAGCPKAAKLLIDLLAPGRSGVTVNQQAVVIHPGDIG